MLSEVRFMREAKNLREQAKQAGYEEGLKQAHEEIEEDRKTRFGTK